MVRRWVFSSRWLPISQRWFTAARFRHLAGRAVAAVFPDDCRLCSQPLYEFSRIPVCANCLKPPEPFEPQYFCSSCRTPFVSRFPLDDQGLCTLCRLGHTRFDAAHTYGAYDGALRRLIHLFKYDGVEPLAAPLGDWMLSVLPGRDFDAVVPMPMHWRRRWTRGFNHAARLARHVARRTGIPLRNLVRRRRGTAPQAGLTSAGRRANVAGAFRASGEVRGLRILLIDDVLTTGATAGACAAALKRAGAASVSILTAARADRRLFSPAAVSS